MRGNKTYIKNIGTLFSGSVFATLIPLLLAPVLTRQYTPAEFGVFAFFVAIADILLVFSTLRLSYAIVIPKKKDDAWNIFVLCMVLSLSLSILIFLIAACISTNFITNIGGEMVSGYTVYVAPYVLFSGLYTSIYAWHNRNGRYKTIAIAKVLSVSIITLASIIFGFLQYGPIGLIFGVLFGKFASTVFMVYKIWIIDRQNLPEISVQSLVFVLKQNKKFPLSIRTWFVV